MRKGKFLKSAVITFVFLLASSAAVPVLASYAAGDGASSGWGWNNTAIGENASVDLWDGTAIGSSSISGLTGTSVGYNSINGGNFVVLGASAISGGSFGTSIGYKCNSPTNIAIGSSLTHGPNTGYTAYTVAIGVGTYADSTETTVIGRNATANDNQTAYTSSAYSTVIGDGATVIQGGRSSIYGCGASTSGDHSTAIGGNTSTSAAATNSVALGYGSVADRANTVSVGSTGNERQITNVADGTEGTDVINVRQLHEFGRKIDKVGAMSAAISSLRPMPHDPKAPLQLLAGGGTYSGRWAAAVGVGFYAHEKFLLKFGMAFCASEKMGQLGLEWKWGRSGKKAAVAQDGSSTVTALQATARQLQDQIKQQQEKTKKQQDQQQDQIKQLQDQIKQLLNTQENPS
ncbi:Adhesin YadA precursor [Sporomusa ovata DSM 2662]|nr:YadA-like family protein [Sporomusa ovata]EQB28474.1 autotransporter adhesin [Sporomusa ovata DSM 2662]